MRDATLDGSHAVNQFRAPKKTLGTLDADAAAKLVAAAGDVALIIDSKGIIKDAADVYKRQARARAGCVPC